MTTARANPIVWLALLVACSAPAPERKPKDPACRDYPAVIGEPCRGDRYLYVGHIEGRWPLCLCETVPK